MNKAIIYGIVIVTFIAILSGISYNGTVARRTSGILPNAASTAAPTVSQSVDYRAGFAIFTNGTFRIFTAAMYHERSADVFINAESPNIVQVKRRGTTWNDFFKTLPMILTSDCLVTGTKETFCTGDEGTVSFYLNGEKTDEFLNTEIRDGDRALVSFGANSAKIKSELDQVPDLKALKQ